LRLRHLSAAELKAYALADNRIAENSTWDNDELRLSLAELQIELPELQIEVMGFSIGEVDVLLDISPAEAKLEEQPAIDRRTVSGVEAGDLWLLGRHRLLCGSSLEPSSFVRVMDGEQARLVFSDPPYNVPIDGFVGGLGRTKHAEFAMGCGEMSKPEFIEFLRRVFANCATVSMDGSIHYQCMDWRHMEEMLTAGNAAYSNLVNMCVWAKDNGGMGSFYRSQHELVFVWKHGTAPHLNTVKLGKDGRYRTNVWKYRGATKTGTNAEILMHPTVKPVVMIMDAIRDTSKRGEIVLDPFGGSGSTLIAAHKTGRQARLIEISPDYCEVIIRRWEKLARSQAVLEATGETFAEVYARRNADMDRAADEALGLLEAA
jgi:DNA modification methylase